MNKEERQRFLDNRARPDGFVFEEMRKERELEKQENDKEEKDNNG